VAAAARRHARILFFRHQRTGFDRGPEHRQRGDGQDRTVEEPRIQAFWLQTAAGYRIEARIPLSFVGSRLWIEAQDGRGSRKAGVDAVDTPDGGRLFFTTAGLDDLLARSSAAAPAPPSSTPMR